MLNAFLRLNLSVDTSCGGGCNGESVNYLDGADDPWIIPAAAAGSDGLLTPSTEGLSVLLDAKGLLLRRVSACRFEGERERRSNLEARLLGSGSV